MEDTRVPTCVMFGEIVGGAGCVEGAEKRVDKGCFLDDLRAFSINAGQRTSATAAHDEGGNGAGRRNKGRDVSWRNESLQRKPGLDYGMQ